MKRNSNRKSNPIQFRGNQDWLKGILKKTVENHIDSRTSINDSDFREDTGSPVSIFEFSKKMLGRTLSEKQVEVLKALWGEDGKTWSSKYHEAVLLIGMKGGKNFLAECDIAYACYFITCLKDPHAYFTKLTNRTVPYTSEKTFDFVNVSSVGSDQARRAFFESVKNVLIKVEEPVTKESWFEKYAKLDFRKNGGHFNKHEIVFPTRSPGVGGIRLLSFNSTSCAPEGVHILRFYADELSRANTKATHKEASDLLELGLNNTSASFPNRVGKVLAWSYPNDTDYDLTVERYELSMKVPHIFGRKYATWEFNPSITRESLEDRFKTDQVKANRVYGCVKSVSKDNFFHPYSYKLDELPSSEIKNKVNYSTKTISRTNNQGTGEFTSIELLGIEGDYRKRCFAIDPSKMRDRFTILGGYAEIRDPFKMEIYNGDTYEIITTNIKPIVDVAIVIEPQPNKPVDYIEIGNIFSQLLRAFPNTQSINSDHYQNEKFRQEILSKGVCAETYHFSNSKQVELYTKLRANVWNNNITLLSDNHQLNFANRSMNITEALIWEAKSLLKEGEKIVHPVWGSKDITDSLAILNYDLMKLETSGVIEDFRSMDRETRDRYLDKYYQHRIQVLESGIDKWDEKLIKETVRQRMGLSEHQFKILLENLFDNYYF